MTDAHCKWYGLHEIHSCAYFHVPSPSWIEEVSHHVWVLSLPTFGLEKYNARCGVVFRGPKWNAWSRVRNWQMTKKWRVRYRRMWNTERMGVYCGVCDTKNLLQQKRVPLSCLYRLFNVMRTLLWVYKLSQMQAFSTNVFSWLLASCAWRSFSHLSRKVWYTLSRHLYNIFSLRIIVSTQNTWISCSSSFFYVQLYFLSNMSNKPINLPTRL